jgi:signal transduction histidine kinase
VSRAEFTPFERGRFERASFARHLAICLAAAAAWFFRDQARAGNDALWIIGITGIINALLTLVADRPDWKRFSQMLSPCFGLAGWATLVHLTGGVSSLFIAGFWLEIVLSAWICSTWATLAVTAGAAAALWAQQGFVGTGGSLRPLVLQTAFLAAMGGVTLLLNRRWARTQSEATSRRAELMEKLLTLEHEIDVLRAVGEVGENVARLAHALKNAVHSLRGFAALIENPRTGAGGSPEAFDGLRGAIDRLEEIARMTLRGVASRQGGVGLVDGAETRRAIEETIAEVSVSHPRIGWLRCIGDPLPSVEGDPAMIRYALLNLARNAAESMDGTGEIAVETLVEADQFEIRIRDHGSGISEEELKRTLEPGFTTKPDGSGFGLFLTRRLVEAHGGRVTMTPAIGGGAIFSVRLPRPAEGLR